MKKWFLFLLLATLSSFNLVGQAPSTILTNTPTLTALPQYSGFVNGYPVLSPSQLTDNGTTLLYKGNPIGGGSGPTLDYIWWPAAVQDSGATLVQRINRYNTNAPTAGNDNPATTTSGWMSFAAASTQYGVITFIPPPYWTSSDVFPVFATPGITTGNVGWIVDTACTNPGGIVSAASFGTAVTQTTTVNSTSGARTDGAIFTSVAIPGTNSCAAGGASGLSSLVTLRVHRSASDTAAGAAELIGLMVVNHRSQ